MKVALALLGAPVALALAACAGWFLKSTPKPPVPPPAPTAEQLTIAAATLVHGLEVQQDYLLAQSPDFVQCRVRKAGGWNCDYSTTYVDESSAVWRITLNRRNVPTVITRIRNVPAPSA